MVFPSCSTVRIFWKEIIIYQWDAILYNMNITEWINQKYTHKVNSDCADVTVHVRVILKRQGHMSEQPKQNTFKYLMSYDGGKQCRNLVMHITKGLGFLDTQKSIYAQKNLAPENSTWSTEMPYYELPSK
jgi:hypothetical protein